MSVAENGINVSARLIVGKASSSSEPSCSSRFWTRGKAIRIQLIIGFYNNLCVLKFIEASSEGWLDRSLFQPCGSLNGELVGNTMWTLLMTCLNLYWVFILTPVVLSLAGQSYVAVLKSNKCIMYLYRWWVGSKDLYEKEVGCCGKFVSKKLTLHLTCMGSDNGI